MAERASASLRELIATYDEVDFELETADNETGYKNVIRVQERYQARLYDKVNQKQRSLPGLFDTAKEAAKYRALVMRDDLEPPPTKPRAPRGSKGSPPKPFAGPQLATFARSQLARACVRSCQGSNWCTKEAAAC